jgi:hypothetical protein
MTSRSYSNRTLKVLWGRAAGRCAVPSCRIELVADATEYDPVVLVGDIAHIVAAADDGPRGDATVAAKERDEFDNLILLCKNCHARLDGQKASNSVEAIKELKKAHEEWVRTSLPERGVGALGWRVLILQGVHPIDVPNALEALAPDYCSGPPAVLTIPSDPASWPNALADIRGGVRALLAAEESSEERFAVFPLAPVSACIALGYCLTSRPRVRCFQYHRDQGSWRWPQAGLPADPTYQPFKSSDPNTAAPLAFTFGLSAAIAPELVLSAAHPVDSGGLCVESPSTGWLVSPCQLATLAQRARSLFEAALQAYPRSQAWHIFYAGPAPGAVVVGQQLNPTMSPPVHLYEYVRGGSATYTHSLVLEEPR